MDQIRLIFGMLPGLGGIAAVSILLPFIYLFDAYAGLALLLGADLVATLLFSVPGGPAAAIFLGALYSFGYYPGPRMVTENPELMYLIVWSVALASVIGAIVCFAITPLVARLTRIPFAVIAALSC
jgi:TctA family transporter